MGDICRGIYADIDNVHGADKNTEGALDDCNFVLHKGFFTTYFYVKKIITNEKGKFIFEYGKRSEATPDPCAYMDFAQYGSFTDDKRQSSMYFSSRGNSYIEVLDGVCNWEIYPQHRVCRYGWLEGLAIQRRDGSYIHPSGNGIFVQDNVYFGGNVEYLGDILGLDDLKNEAKAYDVSLSQYQSVITVDDMGNVINGLYTQDEGKATKQYRISTAVFVRKGMDILLEEDANSENVTEGHYRLHVVSDDCDVEVNNSTVFIKGIKKIWKVRLPKRYRCLSASSTTAFRSWYVISVTRMLLWRGIQKLGNISVSLSRPRYHLCITMNHGRYPRSISLRLPD